MRRTNRSWLWMAGVVVLSMFLAGAAQAATIQGQIVGLVGFTPTLLDNKGTFAAVFQGENACSAKYVGYGILSSTDGKFKISDFLPTTSTTKYFVKSWSNDDPDAPGGRVDYVDTWYSSANPLGTYDCSKASGIEFSGTNESKSIDILYIQKGDYISGKVTSDNNNYTYTDATGSTYTVANSYVLVLKQIAATGSTPASNGCNSPIFAIASTKVSNNTTDAGEYATDNLPAGNYYLQTYSYERYPSLWWTAIGSTTTNCGNANPITITTNGDKKADNDFTLTKSGATVSGSVTLTDGSVGPTNSVQDILINVYAWDTTKSCNQGRWITTAFVKPTPAGSYSFGTYTTPRLEPGDYMLQSYSTLGTYGNEYANVSTSTATCESAEKITILGNTSVSNKNFQLSVITSTTISGTVYPTGGGTTAITDNEIYINVFKYVEHPVPSTNECHQGEWVTTAVVDTKTGTYKTPFLPAGKYLLQSYSKAGYLNEWYTDTANTSAYYCKDATPVVTSTGDAVGKNFYLAIETE